jgi:hypothetical protein
VKSALDTVTTLRSKLRADLGQPRPLRVPRIGRVRGKRLRVGRRALFRRRVVRRVDHVVERLLSGQIPKSSVEYSDGTQDFYRNLRKMLFNVVFGHSLPTKRSTVLWTAPAEPDARFSAELKSATHLKGAGW